MNPLTITESLCQRCGACCSAVVDGEFVSCRHLDSTDGYRCRIYATRPQVCREYSCIREGRIVSPTVSLRVQAAIAAPAHIGGIQA